MTVIENERDPVCPRCQFVGGLGLGDRRLWTTHPCSYRDWLCFDHLTGRLPTQLWTEAYCIHCGQESSLESIKRHNGMSDEPRDRS